MHIVSHFPLCPRSRSLRLLMGEIQLACTYREIKPWQVGAEFMALNPAGELPVLQIKNGPILCGIYAISEHIAEELKRHPVDGLSVPLFPGNRDERAEVRRLVDWGHGKLDREVTDHLLHEKIYARFRDEPAAPNAQSVRAARAYLRYHLSYVSYLAHGRRWLAGEDLSFADLAIAAQFSVADFLGEIPWHDFPTAHEWYARMKSRQSFRPLLDDVVPGIEPAAHYADLDF